MKIIIRSVCAIVLLAFACQTPKQGIYPVNPNTTEETRNLLDFLYSINGKYTLTGQHKSM